MAVVTMAHGSGGKASRRLFEEVFQRYFKDGILAASDDAADFSLDSPDMSLTTDSFVIKPVFFPGGDIGKLSVCGTVNDLAVNGAKPKFLTCAFIIEEGFSIEDLGRIAASMAEWAGKCGARIVAGDTKVVEKGSADGVFINVTGLGTRIKGLSLPDIHSIRPGDKVLLTGTMAEHGIAVLGKRKGLEFQSDIESDCRPLCHALNALVGKVEGVRFMRDPTRGGVATVLNEIALGSSLGMTIDEESLRVLPQVTAACEILGLDPLYIANEGKAVIIVDAASERKAIDLLKGFAETAETYAIGVVTDRQKTVSLKTRYGTERLITMLEGDPLPRIC